MSKQTTENQKTLLLADELNTITLEFQCIRCRQILILLPDDHRAFFPLCIDCDHFLLAQEIYTRRIHKQKADKQKANK